MKRFLSFLLTVILLLTLAACTQQAPAGGTTAGFTAGETSEFVKPEGYASVLLVTINPQFRLYLDAAGKVLAVEAVNEDAKALQESVSCENDTYETAVEKLVTKASEKGYIKADAVIQVEVAENKSTEVNTTDILSKATAAVKQTASKLELNVEVKAEDQTVTDTDSVPETSEDTQATQATEPAHAHSFAEATCTEPKKCQCGETEGKALGHKYKEGVCSRCKAKDPDYVAYKAIEDKTGVWKGECVIGKIYYELSFTLGGEGCMVIAKIGDPLSDFPEDVQADMKQDPTCKEFDGNYYYVAKGDGCDLDSVTEDGTTVTVKDSEGNKLVLTRTGENKLKVKSCSDTFAVFQKIPKGTVLKFEKD